MKPCWLLIAVPLLTGCERGVVITVMGPPNQPVFELGAFKTLGILSGPQPAMTNVSVTTDAGPSTPGAVWAIYHSENCTPTPRFRYGVAPAGYRVVTAPTPLAENVVYRVRMSGCGFYGGVTFKVVAGRIIQAQGNGDLSLREVSEAH